MHSPLLRTKKGWLALAAVSIVPLLYSGSYLSAFWNPYGHLNSLPVAIVNQDQGYHGHQEGLQVIKMLPKDMHTHIFTSRQAIHAQNLLKSGKVDMVVDIPKNFSRDLFHQHAPTIRYTTDPGTNYLTGILMDREASSLTQGIIHHIQSGITHQELQGISQLQNNTRKLHTMTATLAQKSHSLPQYGTTLSQDVRVAATDTQQLAQESQMLSSRFNLFASNIQTFTTGEENMNQGVAALPQSAQNFSHDTLREQQAISTWASQAKILANQAKSLQIASFSENQAVTQLQSDENKQNQLLQDAINLANRQPDNASTQIALQTALNRMQTNQLAIQNLSRNLIQGQSQLNQNLESFSLLSARLSASTQSLLKNALTVSRGSSQLSQSVSQLTQASALLTETAKKIDFASQQLIKPMAASLQGQSTIGRSLSTLSGHLTQYSQSVDGITQAMSLLSTHLAQLAGALGKVQHPLAGLVSPLKTRDIHMGPASNYGSGLSPYFLGLSLWVGSLVVTVLVPGGTRQRLKTRQWLSLGLSLAQFLMLTAGILLLLPFRPQHPAMFWSVLAVITLSWWAIMRFLVEKFGDGGRLLAIVLLVIQLSGSAGTYPINLSPSFFNLIHPYLPMTWAIHVMRYAIAGSYQSVLIPDLIRLLATSAVCWLLTRFLPLRMAFDAPPLDAGKSLHDVTAG